MRQSVLLKRREKKLAVVGLGYVGLQLAVAFDEQFDVVGFDVNRKKIDEYLSGEDVTQEVGDESLGKCAIKFTDDPGCLKDACFIVVAVPTPVKEDNTPDLSPVISACRTVGENMSRETIVVFESTVYPGVTEEICAGEIERASGLKCGQDFYIGYSPERINPGDKVHKLRNIIKIVSGMDEATTDEIAEVYDGIMDKPAGGGIYRAENIRVAEAAKVLENSQRDVNIAFVNEASLAFERMGINTIDVIQAMNTKWNALGFYPGLVGGHCIGVDPYYFIYNAEKNGYHSTIIAAARRLNDNMTNEVAKNIVRELVLCPKDIHQSRIYVMGLTFKGDCPDLRNSKAIQIKKELEAYGIRPEINDPRADAAELEKLTGQNSVPLSEIHDADCLIFAANHSEYQSMTPRQLDALMNPEGSHLIIDICNIFDRKTAERHGFRYWSL